MKDITNRSSVIISPKDPFEKWAKFYNELSDEDCEQRLKEIHVYLVDWSYTEKLEDVLKSYYKEIFEYELLNWNSIKKEWPENRTYELFLEWFEVKVGSDLFDLEIDEIQLENL
jgi:hypothetical protein